MKIASLPQKALLSPPRIRALAAAFLLGAAAVHIAVAPEHFEERWTYGWFFLLVAGVQGVYALGLLASRVQVFRSPWYLVVGIAGSFMLLGLYLVSRLVGIPVLGGHLEQVHLESFGAVDVISKIAEQGSAALLIWLAFYDGKPKEALGILVKSAGLALIGAVALLVLAEFQGGSEHKSSDLLDRLARQSALSSGISSAGGAAISQGGTKPDLPTFQQLLPLLTRSGNGTPPTTADVVYAPPLFFQLAGEEAPRASRERSTAAFYLLEMDHDHLAGVAPAAPPALLGLDRSQPVEPYEVTLLSQDPYHRTSRLLFPLPAGMDPESLNQGRHTLTIFLLLGSSGESAFTWELPLGLPGEAPQPASTTQPANLRTVVAPRALTRTRQGMEYGGKGGIRVDATYATPDYFSAALSPQAASRYLPDRFTVLLVSETLHSGSLPLEALTVSLRLDGQRYQPDLAEQVVSSPHHRVTLLRFPVAPALGVRHRVMELLLPGDERLVWHLPLRADDVRAGSGFQVTWGAVLAVMGGMVAAMWPCLFQLTAFFIPALAGLNMREAGGSVALGRRMGVIRAALFFVLGFTLVYTAAGALIGFAAQRLGDSANFEVWQRYAAIGGGVAIILLALRVAAKVRAPLVCKMPVLSRMAHRRSASSPLEMMFAGVAFATGCMTCFGAALVVTMVVYVGLSGSPAFGALTLFLFSLGMGIPLVLAASAMAKVLPMLFRLEKVIPWLGLASSLIMVGFGVLLITGNYMALSGWVYRAIPPVIIR